MLGRFFAKQFRKPTKRHISRLNKILQYVARKVYYRLSYIFMLPKIRQPFILMLMPIEEAPKNPESQC